VTTTTATQPGLYLVGEYLSGKQEPDQTSDTNGKVYPGRFKVSVLVGDRVFQVEYRDEASKVELIGSPERDDLVTIPVGVRSAKGYTFYFGRRGAE